MIENSVSYITQGILIIGLYFSIFWILLLINTSPERKKLKKYPDVSIITPAYNEEKGLAKTIESVLALKYPGKVVMYIVNDASKDNTLKIAKKYVKKYPKKLILIDKKKNAGKAAALNTAVKKIKTSYFAVMDADSEIAPDSLKELTPHLYREDGQRVGAVISKMKPENETGGLLERVQLIEYMVVGLVRNLAARIGLLHTTPGVLSLYDTKLVREIGCFDHNNMTEDFEVAAHLRKKGHLIEYAYSSKVFTTTPNKFKAFLAQRIRWSRGFIQTHTKHKDIFFNMKYGLYGMYQFPLNVLGPFLYFAAVFTISFKVYQKIYEFLYKLFLNPELIDWFYFGSLGEVLLGIDPGVDFIVIFSLAFVLLFLFFVMRFYDYNFFAKQPFKKLWAVVVYIMFYNYIYIYVWLVALKRELSGEKYSWGR